MSAAPADAPEGPGLRAQCLCGQVVLRVWPQQAITEACHCAMCRRWGGGPAMVVPCGDQVRIDAGAELVRAFDSSEWAQRCFCQHCGSHLFYRTRGGDQHYVAAGLLDDGQGELPLVLEVFIDSKPHGYAFANDTRKLTGAEVFAAAAGGD